MTTAFNTGKVKIGAAYVPRQRIEMTKEDVDLQTALLKQKPPSYDVARWLCTKFKKLLTLGKQRKGCDQHQYITGLKGLSDERR